VTDNIEPSLGEKTFAAAQHELGTLFDDFLAGIENAARTPYVRSDELIQESLIESEPQIESTTENDDMVTIEVTSSEESKKPVEWPGLGTLFLEFVRDEENFIDDQLVEIRDQSATETQAIPHIPAAVLVIDNPNSSNMVDVGSVANTQVSHSHELIEAGPVMTEYRALGDEVSAHMESYQNRKRERVEESAKRYEAQRVVLAARINGIERSRFDRLMSEALAVVVQIAS